MAGIAMGLIIIIFDGPNWTPDTRVLSTRLVLWSTLELFS